MESESESESEYGYVALCQGVGSTMAGSLVVVELALCRRCWHASWGRFWLRSGIGPVPGCAKSLFAAN